LSELSHPMAAQASESAVTPGRRGHGAARAPSFSELVYAHFAWWRDRENPSANGNAAAAYHDALARYERHNGKLVSAYWCSEIESAAALTEMKRRIGWATPVATFHRETDWATQNTPDIARELHRCDELAVRARIVLKGIRQQICMRLVMSSAAHLLSLVDARAAHADEKMVQAALEREREALDKSEAYYNDAANGQAQIIYFSGMVFVAAVVSVVAGVFLAVDEWAGAVAALIAGAFGAVVSVTQRINAGDFKLDYDVGRPYVFFLGGLRPLIGGAFAVVISFAFTGGLLHLPVAGNEPSPSRRLALLVISFAAGFSERWAQDTLTSLASAGTPAEKQRSRRKQPA
jgi:hypothetical protein